MADTEALVVLCTIGEMGAADQLARELVTRHLAACVNVVPGLISHYRWQGEICRDQELLLLIKTTRAGYPALAEALRQLHPYDQPEIIALPVAAGDAGYLSWLAEAVKVT